MFLLIYLKFIYEFIQVHDNYSSVIIVLNRFIITIIYKNIYICIHNLFILIIVSNIFYNITILI